MNDLCGILVVDKPSGWTSHDVVKKTKNLLGGRIKVGHTGTLDPSATGILILLIGKATKSLKYFEHNEKRYLAEVTFGYATDTFDSTGKKTYTGEPEKINIEKLKTAISNFKGASEQLPPMFSAVKVGGKKLYQLARAGKEIERKPRKIFIRKIEATLIDFPTIHLDIICSKGTYIRSIADQIGRIVDCPSHLSALKRIASGTFTIDDAVDFQALVDSGDAKTIKDFIKPLPEPEQM